MTYFVHIRGHMTTLCHILYCIRHILSINFLLPFFLTTIFTIDNLNN